MAIERITRVAGRAVPVRGDNIDTDRIIPARFLRSVSFEGLEQGLFADDRAQADAVRPQSHPISDPRFAGASVMLVNANFGCGSSREHAPQAIRRHGIRGIVGQSFSEIFFGNSVALGMPCVTVGAAEAEELMRRVEADPAVEVAFDLESMTVSAGDYQAPIVLAAAAREAFLDGSWDATALLLDRYEEVARVAGRLPYISAFASGSG